VTYAAITEEGRRVRERAEPVLAAGLSESFAGHLADADVRNLRRSLRKVLEGNGKWEEARCSGPFHDEAPVASGAPGR
jgi:hypothetical protein